MKKIIVVAQIVTFGFLIDCDYDYNPNDFTFEKKPHLGNELRVDGYYYKVSRFSSRSSFQWEFLYRNGVIRNGGSSNDPLGFEQIGWLKDHGKIIWGYFEIIGDSNIHENWTPRRNIYLFWKCNYTNPKI